MALNPFHAFRKHQKVLFAILTIICMFTFVLSSGITRGGDALDWVVSLFGGSTRKQGEVVTELYGKAVHKGELDLLSNNRLLASDFMLIATAQAQQDTTKLMGDTIKQIFEQQTGTNNPSDMKRQLQFQLLTYDQKRVVRMISLGEVFSQYLARDDLQKSFINGSVAFQIFQDPTRQFTFAMQAQMHMAQSPRERFQEVLTDEANLTRLRGQLLQGDNPLKDEAGLVDKILAQVHLELWMRNPDRASGELYFGGSTRTDDNLDFLIWSKQADTLGIVVTEEDVRKYVERLAGKAVLTGDSTQDQALLRTYFQRRAYTVDLKQLYRALTEELRVSLAQATVLGRAPGVPGYMDTLLNLFNQKTPAPITPAEYVEFYRQQRTEMDVAILTVPVAPFMAQVKTEPTEAELKRLFDLYRKLEPTPWGDRPAFKQPRRVKVEWVYAPAGVEPKYLKLAEFARKGIFLGSNPWEVLAMPLALDTAVQQEYNGLRINYQLPSLMEGDPGMAYITATNMRRTVALSVIQPAIGGYAGTFGLLVGPPLYAYQQRGSFEKEAIQKDRQARATSLASAILAAAPVGTGLVPWPGRLMMTNALEARPTVQPWAEAAWRQPFIPLASVRDQAVELLESTMARNLINESLAQFRKELADTKGNAEEARKVVEEGLKKYGLTAFHGSTPTLLDQFALMKDPALKPLHDAYLKSPRGLDSLQGDLFAQLFFNPNSPPYTPGEIGSPSDLSEPHYLFWKTEDLPAKEPTRLDDPDTRKMVVEAWRFNEARKLAKAKADELQKEVNGKDREKILGLFKQAAESKEGPKVGPWFELDKVAQRIYQRNPTNPTAGAFPPYKFPEDKIEYPVAYFISSLLALPVKGATVIPDRPVKHYYVSAVLTRDVPPTAAALADHRLFSFSDRGDPLWQLCTEEHLQQRRQQILEMLRKEAGQLDARGRFVLKTKARGDDESAAGQ